MTGHRSWNADRAARLTDPEIARRAVEARAELDAYERDYRRTLAQMRAARQLTQTQLAKTLGVSQAQVSRVENQADLYLSTLRSYIQAIGGELELRAIFPDGSTTAVTIAELADTSDPEMPTAGRRTNVDLRTAFALVHQSVGRFDSTEEKFHARHAA
jgi:transcriptional regulator with XRE-family HTH domain